MRDAHQPWSMNTTPGRASSVISAGRVISPRWLNTRTAAPSAMSRWRASSGWMRSRGGAAVRSRRGRSAWEEFYSRHATYLYAVCFRAYGCLLGGEPGVCDLVADTFRRAYEHAGTFDDGGVTDSTRQRIRARAWLGRIAQRLVQSALRSRSKTPMRFLDQREWQNLAQARPRAPGAGPQIERVREALMALPEREQLVLRVTMQWYRPGELHQRLPNEVTNDLARTLQTTPENLRQIRRRALRKVEGFLRDAEARTKKREENDG